MDNSHNTTRPELSSSDEDVKLLNDWVFQYRDNGLSDQDIAKILYEYSKTLQEPDDTDLRRSIEDVANNLMLGTYDTATLPPNYEKWKSEIDEFFRRREAIFAPTIRNRDEAA